MITAINIKKVKVLHIFYAVLFLCFSSSSWSQTKVFANGIGAASLNVDNATLAYDGVLTTRADVRAKSNTLILPGYDGYIELQFPTTLAANTTSYVKIATEDNLLSALVGGSLGDLLGSLLGVLLTGNQEFLIEAKLNAGAAVLSGSSTLPAQFGTERLRVVQDAAGNFFIRITPDQPYNRIRLTNKVGAALLGLGTIKRLYVYDAFYISGTQPCGGPTYTSFTGTGILSLGATNVVNPQNVIDANLTNYSTLNIGLISVGASIEQTVYFEGSSQSTDSFGVTLSMSSALLSLNLLGNVSVIASNGGTVVQTKTLSELLTLNLLTMQGDQMTTVVMTPGAPVDRITVRLSSVLSVAQSLSFYGVTKTLAPPVITQNNAICQGTTASLIATAPAAGSQLNWYNVASGGTALATTASGAAFITPALSANTTYYVSQVLGGCDGFRQAVPVTVIATPTAGIIGGEQTVCLTRVPTSITSVTPGTGTAITYKWESSSDEVTWNVIAGETGVEYQPLALLKTTFFRRTTITTVGTLHCESIPTNHIKVIIKNCVVISNPMVRQRMKNGA